MDPKVNFMGKLMCGGGAGVLATISTYPNDTMQGARGATIQYRHAWDCYVKLARQEGWTIYFRRLTPTLVRAVPNMGVQFAAYDFFKSFIEG
ncbi:hypothetical protein PsorP6_004933 [Peronosclerospora sorghi]|uniref:Uncharacterized protein n=1 Tax=Peronosclerospora sorghi TaxID=230839 RepID=A0ACC0W4E4_9STRA|nr:hypothetical protein PsorP6_004933 [Peronosclerospora sorghi]